jgi:hypothetical protein
VAGKISSPVHLLEGDEAEQQQALLQQQQQRQRQQQELVHLETELQYNEVRQRHSACHPLLVSLSFRCMCWGDDLLANEACVSSCKAQLAAA